MRNSIIGALLSSSALLSIAGEALGHELFLKTDSYYVQPNSKTTLTLLNGTFEESAGPVARNRMRDVSISGPSGTMHPDPKGWVDADKQTHLTILLSAQGSHVAGVSTEYAASEQTADGFAEYLKLEGIPDLLPQYDRSAYPKGVRYRYAKHARAIFQVGDTSDDGYSKSLNYASEIVLSTNPAHLRAGDAVRFRALYRGAALANQLVHVGHGGARNRSSSDPAAVSQELRTDKDGLAQFVVTQPGVWYIHLNRMEKSETPGFDFESDRASLTFEVR